MRDLWQAFIDFFTSLKLTVALLVLSMFLVFFATLDQVHLGVWGIQEKWFRAFIVLHDIKGIPVPIYPGGYFLGGLLLINLLAAHLYHFKFTWKKSGIFLTHAGLILLLVGELLTGLWQEEYQLRLDQGQTRNYSESYRFNELVLIDSTDPQFDQVVAIPEKLLGEGASLQDPNLPFRAVVRAYYPNAGLQMRNQVPSAPPSLATTGIGTQLVVTPLPITYRDNERNQPTAFIELIGPGGSLGTWLVSPMLIEPQRFTHAGREWRIALRFEREYKPFSLTLLELRHDIYPGSDIPKNFSSRVRIQSADGREDREALIYMNNPLRYAGLTFYQYQMDSAGGSSVLQVVRNPSWLLPYISCLMMGVGLLAQFSLHLAGFVRQRSRRG